MIVKCAVLPSTEETVAVTGTLLPGAWLTVHWMVAPTLAGRSEAQLTDWGRVPPLVWIWSLI